MIGIVKTTIIVNFVVNFCQFEGSYFIMLDAH